jgi:hypothetical protein
MATEPKRRPRVGAHSRSRLCSYNGGRTQKDSPLSVALVEGRRRTQWCPPGATDSLGARKQSIRSSLSRRLGGVPSPCLKHLRPRRLQQAPLVSGQ